MSSVQIYSSSPAFISTGIKDVSTRVPLLEPEAQPIHLPLFWSFAEKGDDETRCYSGNTLRNTYGDLFLDYTSKYCTHTTPFINGITSEGNMVMFQRLIPADAKKAWIRFSLGVTKKDISEDGTDGTISGYELRWTTSVISPDEVGEGRLPAEDRKRLLQSLEFGQGLTTASLGLLTDPVNALAAGIVTVGADQERIYPIFDLEVSHFGEYGNNLGLRLSAPNTASRSPMNSRFFRNTLVRPFRVEMVKRLNKRSPAQTIYNTSGEATTDFVFKPNTVDPTYNNDVYLGTAVLDNYRNLDNTGGRIPTYGSFNAIKVYDKNVEHILRTLYAAEVEADAKYPLKPRLTKATNEDLEKDAFWQIDFFTGLNVDGDSYRAIKVVDVLDGRNSISLSPTVEHWARGGDDGDVSIDNYHRMVEAKLLEFGESTNPFLDMAKYPFSVFYDTGFPMEMKRAMGTLISARKDVSISLTTHEVDTVEGYSPNTGVIPLDRTTEGAAVTRIVEFTRSRAESDIHGTGCVRANIIMQCGNIIGSSYRGLVPLNYELAVKRARFMGAANGVMRPGYGYDQDGIKQIQYMNNITNAFVPQEKRELNWANGASWAQSYDRSRLFFPAVRTVYKDDTSVLLSDINMMIVTDLQKVCFRSWRRLSGDAKMTPAQLADASNTMILQDVAGRYDGRAVIKPDTFYTPADEQRGYSWHCDVHAYLNNMRTVGVFTVITHRQSDLEGGN